MTMVRGWLLVAAAFCGARAFTVPMPMPIRKASPVILHMGLNRKARREMKNEEKRRGSGLDRKLVEELLDDDDDDDDEKVIDPDDIDTLPDDEGPKEEVDRSADKLREVMEERMKNRPELTDMVYVEEMGTYVVRRGRRVMDLITRKAVYLSEEGPSYRLAQMFPGVPPDVRKELRYDWPNQSVPDMIDALEKASMVTLEDGTRGIPPHPNVANKALDFAIANLDYLGYRMHYTLQALMCRAAWKKDIETMKRYRWLSYNFQLVDKYLVGPFKQIVLDAELIIGPNFGNLDLASYCSGEVYERAAFYIVLKGMQCTWEQKLRDAELLERYEEAGMEEDVLAKMTGDHRRFGPGPIAQEAVYKKRDCARVAVMAQLMVKTFVETTSLFADLPVELRFLEEALKIRGGSVLRRFVVEDFCPREGITPELLREGLRRVSEQLRNMNPGSYRCMVLTMGRLVHALSVGTDDEEDPYDPYLYSFRPDQPGYYQTYTFNHHPKSIVAFLDTWFFDEAGKRDLLKPVEGEEDENFFDSLFTTMEEINAKENRRLVETIYDDDKEYEYKVPEQRACGRPHELGWLDLIDAENEKMPKYADAKPGRIIYE